MKREFGPDMFSDIIIKEGVEADLPGEGTRKRGARETEGEVQGKKGDGGESEVSGEKVGRRGRRGGEKGGEMVRGWGDGWVIEWAVFEATHRNNP